MSQDTGSAPHFLPSDSNVSKSETKSRPAFVSNGKENAIELRDVKKTFDNKDFVLNGIDLEIPKGQITVIIGYSGTGKSVLLKHILGLLKPTSGSIKVHGKEITTMTDLELTDMRQGYGMLFQYAALFDDMTAIENVMFPLREHRRKMKKAEMLEVAKARLHDAGLDPKHFNKTPSEMSGGMRKRVGLARALALDPEILIYDEPTTGLDPVLTEMVDNLIVSTHNLRKGSTSVVVSHDLYAAFRIGDHVAMLDNGRVLLYGTPDDFLNSEIDLVKRFVAKGVRKELTPKNGESPEKGSEAATDADSKKSEEPPRSTE
jgi:phospholipid/cholesterol/gamma-HCH transport system ATP-binding protein